jgi:hypothetical protein
VRSCDNMWGGSPDPRPTPPSACLLTGRTGGPARTKASAHLWGGPPGPRPTPPSACLSTGRTMGPAADEGVRPTARGRPPTARERLPTQFPMLTRGLPRILKSFSVKRGVRSTVSKRTSIPCCQPSGLICTDFGQ